MVAKFIVEVACADAGSEPAFTSETYNEMREAVPIRLPLRREKMLMRLSVHIAGGVLPAHSLRGYESLDERDGWSEQIEVPVNLIFQNREFR